MKKLAIILAAITIPPLGEPGSALRAQDYIARSERGDPSLVIRIDPITDVVYIDWSLVEQTARGRGPVAEQPLMVAASKIMLAVRDHKWKKMPK